MEAAKEHPSSQNDEVEKRWREEVEGLQTKIAQLEEESQQRLNQVKLPIFAAAVFFPLLPCCDSDDCEGTGLSVEVLGHGGWFCGLASVKSARMSLCSAFVTCRHCFISYILTFQGGTGRRPPNEQPPPTRMPVSTCTTQAPPFCPEPSPPPALWSMGLPSIAAARPPLLHPRPHWRPCKFGGLGAVLG